MAQKPSPAVRSRRGDMTTRELTERVFEDPALAAAATAVFFRVPPAFPGEAGHAVASLAHTAGPVLFIAPAARTVLRRDKDGHAERISGPSAFALLDIAMKLLVQHSEADDPGTAKVLLDELVADVRAWLLEVHTAELDPVRGGIAARPEPAAQAD